MYCLLALAASVNLHNLVGKAADSSAINPMPSAGDGPESATASPAVEKQQSCFRDAFYVYVLDEMTCTGL